jgi:hypothetical protein
MVQVRAEARVAEAGGANDEAEDEGGVLRGVAAAVDLSMGTQSGENDKQKEGKKGPDLSQSVPPKTAGGV